VGISTTVHGAGGFGKTTVAKLVRADPRILRRFGNRVYWVTLGRDVRAKAAIVLKVNDLISRLDPERAVAFTDPQQAGEHLAALLAMGPPRLLVLDDVWYPEQLSAFPVGGRRCARLVTTRIPSLVTGEGVSVRVDQVTLEQARAMLTAELPFVPSLLVAGLIAETGRWPLLLRLVNKVLVDQTKTEPDLTRVARELLERLRRDGPLILDQLTDAVGQELDVNDPQQRQRAVAATIEASLSLLMPQERSRFAELSIFAEGETVPIELIAGLWHSTGGLDLMATRRLCARLEDLALLSVVGTGDHRVVSLHNVIRDLLREELGATRLVELHQILLHAAAIDLPDVKSLGRATVNTAGAESSRTAWWKLQESSRYLWDHLIEHLLGAERRDDAAALAADLRWVSARLSQSGPIAPLADLAPLDTFQCVRLHRLLGQLSHLLAPTKPAHSQLDVLYSRVAHDPYWGPQAADLSHHRAVPRLTNRWVLPDLPSPGDVRTLADDADVLVGVAVSPDSSWLATVGAFGTVRIWDADTWSPQSTLIGRTEAGSSVTTVVVASDGSWLAAGEDDGTVHIWDTVTWEQQAEFTAYNGPVDALAVAPDGSWLATIPNGDWPVRIWDTATWALRAHLPGHTGTAGVVAVAPDGSWVATGGGHGTVLIWDTATWKPRAQLTEHARKGKTVVVETAAVAPDSRWLATGDDHGTVRIWDTATWKPQAQLTEHTDRVAAVAVAPDGSWLATTDFDEQVRIWDTATWTKRAQLATRLNVTTTRVVPVVVIAPDGGWLVILDSEGALFVWDTATWTRRARLTGHGRAVRAAMTAPDGSWLAVASDGGVRIWDAGVWTQQAEHAEHTGPIEAVAVSPVGGWLVTAGPDQQVRIWDTITRTQQKALPVALDLFGAVAVGPDGTWLVTAGPDQQVRIWDTTTRTQQTALPVALGPFGAMALASDGNRLVTGGDDKTVRVWDTATWTQQAQLTEKVDLLEAVALAPGGRWLATADLDRQVRIWDTTTGSQQARLPAHIGMVWTMAVARDGKWLATAGDDAVRIWDTGVWTERAKLTGYDGRVTAVAEAPDGKWLAITGSDATVRIWDLSAEQPHALMRVDKPVETCAWMPDCRSIAVGGYGGLYMFDFHPGTTQSTSTDR